MAEGDGTIETSATERAQARRPGDWSERRRSIFLDHLAAGGSVDRAAEAAGVAALDAHALRRRNPDFADSWDAALAAGYARLEGRLIERALDPGGPDLDRELALALLRQHRGPGDGRPRGGAAAPRMASMAETDAAILRKLKALNKRLGGKG